MQAPVKQKRPRLEGGLLGYDGGSSDEEDAKKSKTASKKNHCEVEKRRRDKMNKYLTELATMIPACSAVPRKLDKLTVLKMAVEHVKALRGDPYATSDYKPSFLSDDELKQLVVEAANGFMLIISCQQARVLYVSETVEDVLHESQDAWKGQFFYDILHPKDIQKVKAQLDCMNMEETLQANAAAGYGKSPLVAHPDSMSGLRRSFLCRVRVSQQMNKAEDASAQSSTVDYNKPQNMMELMQSNQLPHKYAVLHCTGFIRSLTAEEREALCLGDGEPGQCLVAMARLQPFGSGDPEGGPPQEPSDTEFVARVSLDGRFSYLDHRVTAVLGYLPQDLIGQMCYEYFHPDDIRKMVELFHEACKKAVPMPTVNYRFLGREKKWVWLAMKAFSFRNPYSKQVEYIICTNVLLKSNTPSVDNSTATTSGLPSMDIDRMERTDAFVRTTIAHHARQVLAYNPPEASNSMMGGSPAGIPQPMYSAQSVPGPSSSGMRPRFDAPMSSMPPMLPSNTTPMSTSGGMSSARNTRGNWDVSGQILQQPVHSMDAMNSGADMMRHVAIFEQNQATAHNAVSQMGLDPNNPFAPRPQPPLPTQQVPVPTGLFDGPINIDDSKEAYMALLRGLDNPHDFPLLFEQVEADPFNATHPALRDLDLDTILD